MNCVEKTNCSQLPYVNNWFAWLWAWHPKLKIYLIYVEHTGSIMPKLVDSSSYNSFKYAGSYRHFSCHTSYRVLDTLAAFPQHFYYYTICSPHLHIYWSFIALANLWSDTLIPCLICDAFNKPGSISHTWLQKPFNLCVIQLFVQHI